MSCSGLSFLNLLIAVARSLFSTAKVILPSKDDSGQGQACSALAMDPKPLKAVLSPATISWSSPMKTILVLHSSHPSWTQVIMDSSSDRRFSQDQYHEISFTFGRVRFELGSWSRLAKFPPTVAGEIGFEGLKKMILRREHTS